MLVLLQRRSVEMYFFWSLIYLSGGRRSAVSEKDGGFLVDLLDLLCISI